MRAAVFTEFGPPEVLHVTDLAQPSPGPGEVAVAVHTTGLQPAEAKLRAGISVPGLALTFPAVLGLEFAGEILAVGDGVEGFAVGDAVLGTRRLNCYAEQIVASAKQVLAKPVGMSWAAAGALLSSGTTALTMIEELRIKPGDTFLMHAAAGGVGSMAVQLAIAAGATVIGTASQQHHDWLRSLGVCPVTYGDGLVKRIREIVPEGVDATLDAVGGEALEASVEVTNDRSRIITIVDFERASQLGVRSATGRGTPERAAKLLELWNAGKLAVHVRRRYPLEQAAAAHRELETHHGRGKIVLDTQLPADADPEAGE